MKNVFSRRDEYLSPRLSFFLPTFFFRNVHVLLFTSTAGNKFHRAKMLVKNVATRRDNVLTEILRRKRGEQLSNACRKISFLFFLFLEMFRFLIFTETMRIIEFRKIIGRSHNFHLYISVRSNK